MDLKIAEIAATSGENNDGIVRGKVNLSKAVGVVTNTGLTDKIYVLKRDAGDGYGFKDITTSATANIIDGCAPFGEDATFSADDRWYIANGDLIGAIYFELTTSAQYVGDGFEIYDSSDGIRAGRLLAFTDTSNGMRGDPGMHVIKINRPNTSQSFSPVVDDIPSRHWIMIKLKNVTSTTKAPKLKNIWASHIDSMKKYYETTSVINGDINSGDFSSVPTSIFVEANSEIVYILPFTGFAAEAYIYRKSPDASDGIRQYLASDNTWKTFTGFVDPSNEFENGPDANTGVATQYSIRWSIPSDWTAKTVSYPMTDGATKSFTGYVFRRYAPIGKIIGPITPSLYRLRFKCFGADNSSGLYHASASTYRAVSFNIGVPSPIDVKIQLVNINTGQATTFTIPANTLNSWSLSGQRIDLNPTLEIRAGDSLLISHSSGGTLKDIELHLLT